MISFVFYWCLIGLALCFQHSCRFYIKNKIPLKMNSYKDVFEDSKLFYFTCLFLWIFALDFMVEVEDYKEIVKRLDR